MRQYRSWFLEPENCYSATFCLEFMTSQEFWVRWEGDVDANKLHSRDTYLLQRPCCCYARGRWRSLDLRSYNTYNAHAREANGCSGSFYTHSHTDTQYHVREHPLYKYGQEVKCTQRKCNYSRLGKLKTKDENILYLKLTQKLHKNYDINNYFL